MLTPGVSAAAMATMDREYLHGVPRYLTTGEAAREIGCSPTWIYQLVEAGNLRLAGYTMRVTIADGRPRLADFLFMPEEISRFQFARAAVSPALRKRMRAKGPAQMSIFFEFQGGRR